MTRLRWLLFRPLLKESWSRTKVITLMVMMLSLTAVVTANRVGTKPAVVSAPEALKVCQAGSIPHGKRVRILAVSEAKALCETGDIAAVLADYEHRTGIDLDLQFAGGNEVSLALQSGDPTYQAYILPDSLVAAIKDADKQKGTERAHRIVPIGKMPVVVAIKGSALKEKLVGGGNRISPEKLLEATQNGLKLEMSPPTQLSSGTWAFSGIVNSLTHQKDLTGEAKAKVQSFLHRISPRRTDASKVTEAATQNVSLGEAFIGTEWDVIQLNKKLLENKTPRKDLYRVLYLDNTPAPTLSLVFTSGKDAAKGAPMPIKQELRMDIPFPSQTPLPTASAKPTSGAAPTPSAQPSSEPQKQLSLEDGIVELERTVESSQFRKETVRVGIRPERNAIQRAVPFLEPLPDAGASDLGFDSNVYFKETNPGKDDGVAKTVETYQDVRPPSVIFIAGDYSGSMAKSEPLMESALESILNADRTGELLLTVKDSDIRGLFPFSSKLRAFYRAVGPKQSTAMVEKAVHEQSAAGETAFYSTVVEAHKKLAAELQSLGSDRGRYRAVIVAMTDGKDTVGGTPQQVLDIRKSLNQDDVLLVLISFGDADVAGMKKLAADANGLFCLGDRDSLKSCFVQAVGNGS